MILDDLESVETRGELARVVDQMSERTSPHSDAVTRLGAADGGFDRDLWRRLIDEVGVLGLTVPESLGGAGASFAEAAAVVETLAARPAAIPLLGAIASIEAVRLGSPEVVEEFLEQLMGGQTLGTVWLGTGLTTTVGPDGVTVSGTADAVVDGGSADVVVVSAETEDGSQWFVVRTEGADRRRLDTLDLARDVTTVVLDGARATPVGGDRDLGTVLRDLMIVLVAVEQLGVAEQALRAAVHHASTREQFGRVIGSFQSVKHLLADMAVESDLARSMVEHAVWAVVEGDPGLAEAAAMASMAASRAATFASAESVQVHGGIGFSWEHPAHLLFRKARSNEQLVEPDGAAADRVLAANGAQW